jgi:hypothetical protein
LLPSPLSPGGGQNIPASETGAIHKVRRSGRGYIGFRAGDPVTILGTVVIEGSRRALSARTIYGGTAQAYARDLERQARVRGGIGLLAALVGVLFLRALLRTH